MKIKPIEEIKVSIVYNAFDPSNMVKEKLVYQKGKTLSHYLHDLPDDCDWRIGVNGIPVTLEDNADLTILATDSIQLVVVPHGGDGVKSVLRIVALVALTVAVAVLTQGMSLALQAAVTAGVTIVGGLIINSVLAPKGPKQDKDESKSYGYDGAKNTIKEGVALPVIYGEYRVAGNYVDLFSEAVGDDQYLSGRTVLSEGEIDSVRDPIVNDQPIANYTSVDWGFKTGKPEEDINPWFNRNITQINKGQKIIGLGDYVVHTTTNAVDQIQINLQFARGLVNIDEKKGTKKNRTASVEVMISPHGLNQWTALGSSAMTYTTGPLTATPSTSKLGVVVVPDYDSATPNADYSYTVEYKRTSETQWKTIRNVKGNATASVYTSNRPPNTWGIPYEALGLDKFASYAGGAAYEWTVPAGEYNVRIVGGKLTSWGYLAVTGGQSTYSFTEKKAAPVKKTLESGILPYGIYDIRFKKTTADGTDEYEIDDLYLTDVGEITTTGISLANTANAYYRIKATEQLSGVPNVTWLVKGVKVNKYDMAGNVTANEWSDNPAWIVLDMLIGPQRGTPGIYDIDFYSFVDWAKHCEDNGLKFNAVFDETTSLWDACVDVLKVGHAAFSRIGTKLSLAIDRPSQPVMLFGPGNIFKDTFKISYLPMTGRANEFEVSYFDRADENKQKTIRIVDPDADNRGDIPRPVSYSLVGVDNFEQAQKEAWYQLYNNRYLRRTISFDAPVESIGLGIGDVAYIQHDMMDWGFGGRIASGSGNFTAKLDKPVLMESGNDYSILVITDAIVRATGDYTSAIGDVITVTNVTSNSLTMDNVKRLVQPATGVDRAILAIGYAGSTAYVTVADGEPYDGSTLQFIDTDVVEERDVVFKEGEWTSVDTTSSFSSVPALYANYMFGIKSIVKKPYRLKSVNGTGFDSRTLTFIEYNEAVYNPPEQIVPYPPTSTPKGAQHVTDLAYMNDPRTTDVNTTVNGVLSWKTKDPRYGGVDIYTGINGGPLVLTKSILNATECQLTFSYNDEIEIKVVAFNTAQTRAPAGTAPTLRQIVSAGPILLSPPTDLKVTPVTYLALGIVEATWGTAVDLADVPVKYRVQIMQYATTAWDEYAVTSENLLRIGDLKEGSHSVRVRTERGEAYSTWVENTFSVAKGSDAIEPGATVGAPNGTKVGDKKVEDIVKAINNIVENGFGDTEAPLAPTELKLTSVIADNGTATLNATWKAPTASDLSGYDVFIREGMGSFQSYTTSQPSYQWTNLRRGQEYTVRVQAYDKAMNRSAFTANATITMAKDTVAPAIATALKFEKAFNFIQVSWMNPADNDLAYAEVYHNIVSNSASATMVAVVNCTPSTRSDYMMTGLTAGSDHYFWIKLVDTSGNKSAFSADSGLVKTAFVDTVDLVPGLAPIGSYDTLPNPVGYKGPDVVFNKTDRKLYRYADGKWTAAVQAVDITGQVDSTQIAKNAVTEEKLNKGAVTRDKLADNTITTEKLVDKAIKADKIDVGAIIAEKIADAAITADKIARGVLDASKFADNVSPVQWLPALPAQPYKAGAVVILTTQGNKLYRSDGTKWISGVDSEDLVGPVLSTQIDPRGLEVVSPTGDVMFGADGYISAIASLDLDGNNVLLSDIARNSLVPSLNYVGEFASPPTQAILGSDWKQNAVYKNTRDGRSYVLTGDPLDWVIYLSDGNSFDVRIESSNGTVFRVGQAKSTLLIARLFKNGAEVTSDAPASWFKWRRVSGIPREAPYDDATWNDKYKTGYKQINIDIDAVNARATFFIDIVN